MPLSFEDFAGAGGAGSPPSPSKSPVPANLEPPALLKRPSGRSFDDFAGPPDPSNMDRVLMNMKKVGGDAAVLADMVLGLPGFAYGLTRNLGTVAGAAAAGALKDPESRQEVWAAGREAAKQVSPWISSPVHELMSRFKTGQIYEESHVAGGMEKVSGLIDKAARWMEEESDGSIPADSMRTLADTLMMGAGDIGIKMLKGVKEARAKAPPEPPIEPSPAKVVEQGPRATAQQQINEMLSIKSKKEQEAWNKKRQKEVREAFKADPDYADYLKFAAEERVSRHDNWTKEAARAEALQENARSVEVPGMPKPEQVTWGDALRVLKKPGHERTAEDLITLRYFNKERGEVDPRLLARMAAAGIGIAGGVWLDPDRPIEGAILGAAGALGMGLLMEGKGVIPEGFRAKEAGAAAGPTLKAPESIPTDRAWLMKDVDRTAVPGSTDLKELTEKIKKEGIKKPITVTVSLKDGLAYVTDGNNRLAAARELGLKDIPVKWETTEVPFTEEQVAKASSVEELGIKREAFKPKELTPEQIADREELRRLLGEKERGEMTMKQAGQIAALGAGALAGAAFSDEDKIAGAVEGALAAFALTAVSPRGVANVFRKIWAPDTRLRIDQFSNLHDYRMAAAARVVTQLQSKIEKLVPKLADREAITHWIEGDESVKLSENGLKAAKIAQQFFNDMAGVGQARGVLKDAVDNYVTHLWSFGTQTKSALQEIFGRKGPPTLSPESRFALRRSVPTIREGKARGLRPQTEDVSAIMGIYSNALARSLANKEMLQGLKAERAPDGALLVDKSTKAPANYVHVDHPQLAGYRVHPDIAPSMRFIFDNYRPGVVQRGLLGLNTLVKRMAVSFSLFHAKALADAFIGAASHPLTVGKQLAQAAFPKVFGENEMLRQLREGGAGDLVDMAQKGGLQFTIGREAPVVEDVRGTFYSSMTDLQEGLDSVMPGLGMPVRAFTKLNHLVDRFMWDRLHTGMKLSIFAEKYSQLLENNARAHARDSMVPLRKPEDIAAIAADFTNSIFGGLNWRRIAESSATRWGREAALAAYSPTGRRMMQILFFAPDWTISTTRAAAQAFGRLTGKEAGTGLRGLFKPQTLTDLHRQYLVRSAIYYLAVGDALNYSLSGHHLWENKDWTTIDLGDGRRMQWSKHTMEPIHWAINPAQQAINKLGFIPREMANQIMGSEYLSTAGHAPRMQSRLGHIARQFSPIAVQQNFEAGDAAGIAGFFGAPIYGKTAAQISREKARRRVERAMHPYKKKEKR